MFVIFVVVAAIVVIVVVVVVFVVAVVVASSSSCCTQLVTYRSGSTFHLVRFLVRTLARRSHLGS